MNSIVPQKMLDPEKQRAFQRRSSFQNGLKPKAPKPQRWSHQKELDALKGKTVLITFMSGSAHSYTLLDADQFTLRLQSGDDERSAILFKHAIVSVELA